MALLEQQRQELEERERELTESLKKFDRFVKENNKKKKRAMLQTQEEKKHIQAKSSNIDNLQVELEGLQHLHDEQSAAIEKLTMYNAYLKSVIDLCPGYSHPRELIGRFETLALTNEVLEKKEKKEKRKRERERERECVCVCACVCLCVCVCVCLCVCVCVCEENTSGALDSRQKTSIPVIHSFFSPPHFFPPL